MATENHPICEVIGCNATASAARELPSVLDGYTRNGKFIPTRAGASRHQFCERHAGEFDACADHGNYIAERCCY